MHITEPSKPVSPRQRSKMKHSTLNAADLDAEPLELASGVIWTALDIDYPGHSFSHLGLFFGKVHTP